MFYFVPFASRTNFFCMFARVTNKKETRMKKIFGILIAAFGLWMAMSSQAQVKFGVKGGLNITKLKFKESAFSSENKTGVRGRWGWRGGVGCGCTSSPIGRWRSRGRRGPSRGRRARTGPALAGACPGPRRRRLRRRSPRLRPMRPVPSSTSRPV